jgi:hypothetical protein
MHLWKDDESFAPGCMPATMAFNVYIQRLGHCAVRRATIEWNYTGAAARPFEPLPFNGSACCRRRGVALECARSRKGGAGAPHLSSNPTFFSRHACEGATGLSSTLERTA